MKRHEWILKQFFCYNFNKFLQPMNHQIEKNIEKNKYLFNKNY